jgi:hypothetical protein
MEVAPGGQQPDALGARGALDTGVHDPLRRWTRAEGPLLISWFGRRSGRRDGGDEVERAALSRPEDSHAHLKEQDRRTDRVDWEMLHREHGLSEGQKLYVGKYEPGRLGGRTSVWVDGMPLNGQFSSPTASKMR